MKNLTEKPLNVSFSEFKRKCKIPRITPVMVPFEGVSYLDRTLAPPYKYKFCGRYFRPRNVTSGTVYSIIIPVKNPWTQEFRIVRDNQREFTSDGQSMLFMLNKRVYGVIYPDHPMFYRRGGYDEISDNSIVSIFAGLV